MKIEGTDVEELKEEAENLEEETIQKHEKHYSDDRYWNKIQKFSKKAGSTVVYAVLILYYTLQKPEIPLKVKITIAGALGYFILPLDLIPDVALGVGFVDDLAVITAALFQVAMFIDDEIKLKAKDKLTKWFGKVVDTSEIDNKI
ncbi:YkvA family protein [Aquibacillus sp. LR5S19]|uniref:YkvA family protein n=2 Tax=Aquibacillus rhizosphaerae TaxID=3051431 RepID=A0ABT7L934_9BACI|nr:YkvA family protein [Aquibacillus sp. LR5S19]MDL4842372.1 YkvA family protein [Aquibacillus sp. LR5S19]